MVQCNCRWTNWLKILKGQLIIKKVVEHFSKRTAVLLVHKARTWYIILGKYLGTELLVVVCVKCAAPSSSYVLYEVQPCDQLDAVCWCAGRHSINTVDCPCNSCESASYQTVICVVTSLLCTY